MISFKYLKISISLFLLIVFSAMPSHASDLLWLAQELDCDSFGAKLSSYFDGLSEFPDEQQDKLTRRVVSVACGSRYRKCSFDICELSAAKRKPAASASDGSFKMEPLAWLKMELSCEGFLEQFQVRYAPLGAYSQLPKEKQKEIDHVLDVACSERFVDCGFKSCKKNGQVSAAKDTGGATEKEDRKTAKPEAVTKTYSPEEAWDEAEGRFERYYKSYRSSLSKEIEEQITRENKAGLQWAKFSVEGFSAPRPRKKKVERSSRRNNRSSRRRWRRQQ